MSRHTHVDDEQLRRLFESTALTIWDNRNGPVLWNEEDLPAPFKLSQEHEEILIPDTTLFERLYDQGLISREIFEEIDLYFDSRKDWAHKYLFTNTDLFNMTACNENSKESLKKFIEHDPWDFESAASQAFHALKENLKEAPACPSENGGSNNAWMTSAQATVHCMTGCIIGEAAGLAIGTTLGLGTAATIGLAFGLAYVSGFALGLLPLMRRENMSLTDAFKVIWLGEAVSIFAMEIAMNAADYAAGGMDATSVADPVFWIGLAAAIPAGFLAAWPVNHWLLKNQLKKCHHHDTANNEDNTENSCHRDNHNPPAPGS